MDAQPGGPTLPSTGTTATASVAATAPVITTHTSPAFTQHRTDNPFGKTPVTAPVVVVAATAVPVLTPTPLVSPASASTGLANSTSVSSATDTTTPTGAAAAADTGQQPPMSDTSGGRSSVILAPARLAFSNSNNATTGNSTGSTTTGASISAGTPGGAAHTMAANPVTINNYFSSNFGAGNTGPTSGSTNTSTTAGSGILAESRLSSAAGMGGTAATKSLLRPSVLRFADSSTNNSQSAPKEPKVFAFVSLTKEDIPRPATTLFPADCIIRCGADTTSPFNGEEAPNTSATGASAANNGNSAVNSTTSGTAATTTSPSFSVTNSTSPAVTAGAIVTSSSGDVAAAGGAVAGPASSSDSCDDSNSQSAFVFGQNLSERAVFVQNSGQKHGLEASDDTAGKRVRTGGSDDESAAKHDINGDIVAAGSSAVGTAGDGKTDGALDLSSTAGAAAEPSSPDKYSANSGSDNKRKYEVITGEEDEQNVLSMHCRLYAWETDNWRERGRGCLRLNDAIKDDKLCSRIVMRTSGALRVILNAHLVSGMRFDMSSEQCLRFTNVDGIYLIKGAPKDIDQLNSAIDYRLHEISKRCKTDDQSSAVTAAGAAFDDEHRTPDKHYPYSASPPADSPVVSAGAADSHPLPQQTIEDTSNDS